MWNNAAFHGVGCALAGVACEVGRAGGVTVAFGTAVTVGSGVKVRVGKWVGLTGYSTLACI